MSVPLFPSATNVLLIRAKVALCEVGSTATASCRLLAFEGFWEAERGPEVRLFAETAVNWEDWAVERAFVATVGKGGLEGDVLEVVISRPWPGGAWRTPLYLIN